MTFEKSNGSVSIETRGKTKCRPPVTGRYIDLVMRRCRIFSLWLWSSHLSFWDTLERWNRSALIVLASLNTLAWLISPALTSALFNKGCRGESARFNLELIIIIAANYQILHIRSCIVAFHILVLIVTTPCKAGINAVPIERWKTWSEKRWSWNFSKMMKWVFKACVVTPNSYF